MGTGTTAFDSARTYLNDVGKQIWTDAVLLPFLVEAHGDMVLELWNNGLPILREISSDINVAIDATALTSPPSNLVEPIWMKERAQGSSDDWINMTEKDFEPDINQAATLRYWAWRDGTIQFVGADTAREIRLRYHKSLTVPTGAGSALGLVFAEFFLGPQTAGYAAASVGNLTLASELIYIPGVQIGVAGSKFSIIIRANVKGQQNLPARRIGYRRFARSH
jgi:hypothetical protein